MKNGSISQKPFDPEVKETQYTPEDIDQNVKQNDPFADNRLDLLRNQYDKRITALKRLFNFSVIALLGVGGYTIYSLDKADSELEELKKIYVELLGEKIKLENKENQYKFYLAKCLDEVEFSREELAELNRFKRKMEVCFYANGRDKRVGCYDQVIKDKRRRDRQRIRGNAQRGR